MSPAEREAIIAASQADADQAPELTRRQIEALRVILAGAKRRVRDARTDRGRAA